MPRHAFWGPILKDTDLSTTANSKPFRLENLDRFSIQAAWTGTPSGTFRLQFSDDSGDPDQGVPTITNWTDDTDSVTTITAGAGSPLRFNWEGIGARWVRVQWQNSSGTGTLTSLRISAKGAG